MISLRHIEESDRAQLVLYITNAEVAKYLTWQPYTDELHMQTFIERAKKATGYPDEFLAVDLDGTLIGTIHLVYRGENNVQFGFGMLPAFWGKGIGKKIIELTRLHITNTVLWNRHVRYIWADVHMENKRARRVLEQSNFFFSTCPFVHEERVRYIWKKTSEI